MKINDVILRTITKIIVFIILTFGVYLFFQDIIHLVVDLSEV